MKLHRGNFFLVGMMGSGKTALGRHLAVFLDKAFVDADNELEAFAKQSIPDIFNHKGEPYFRELETLLLDDLVRRENIVLATGGGTVLREENQENLCANGTVIYLHATPEMLTERLRGVENNRPLLSDTVDMLARQRELYRIRDPLYRKAAHYIYETSLQKTFFEMAKDLSERLKTNEMFSQKMKKGQ
ncbi:MAG: shikimate kinase [Burkholderiales bacterium]|jgi:shikimate kinase|nr:shikimate kinase [Burkholderiales bacterium]